MKKKVIALSLVVGSLFAAGCTLYQPNTITTDNAYVHSDVTAISPEVGGQVSEIFVKDNQWVSKGTPLFVIDDEDFIANKEIARAALDVASSALTSNQIKTDMQLMKIEQAKQGIRRASANAAHQAAEFKRLSRLVQKQSVSKNQFEAQKTRSIEASSNLETAKLALATEQKQLDTLMTEKLQLTAQRTKAEASLRLANISLERTTVRAPFDGYVANRQVQVGKFVQPGMGLIVMVPDYVWIEANFKETQLENVLPGQEVEVVLDMFPNHPLHGRVSSITPATGAQFSLLPPQNATGNFIKVVQRVPVRIELEIPQELSQRIYPGLSAEVSIETATQG
ncbi:HlyD family secretion protein [Vibrio parahaemolyticus]|uniref:HlyD family efflux transporter periplasmic adaptor subunit n=2 Tax=Vibrio parahaemolyticus TaxID=670 RepID=A0A7Z2RPV5_VIBPH|nr:HlyD family secretion protein [Vibrio parahaemolyticus]EJG0923060.1 HlyD family secretion protein [Vibrio parahaemolyticus O1:K68]EJG0932663.1 HlyD family secretion protein [Vibrio parahaemolyticus O1]EJG0946811.1 HlyD family secretion protein [Vibrio parahaemolyticus O10]EQM50219.1 efflux transporter, RND family, MFP subunit [Vibrio parahaemolyticus VPCR-2010]KCV74639.1 multidrug transporter [Vibrio parahaemolyticus VP49]